MTDVVWAEDSASDQFLIRSILDEGAPGLRVEFAEDGQRAIELVARLRPAFLVLDLKMPRVDGLEALRRLAGGIPGQRILVFSSSGQPAEIDAVRALGAGGFVQKPIDYGAFRLAVLGIAQQASQAATAHRPGGGSAVHHVLFWDSETTLLRAVERFLQHAQSVGHGALALATPGHRRVLEPALGADVVWIDAQQWAEACPADPTQAVRWFEGPFTEALGRASRGGTRPVACFGEVVAVLHAHGRAAVARAIERVGQEAATREAGRLAILCAYPVSLSEAERDAACALHTATVS